MQTLKYARAAAVVQACSYKIDDSVTKDHLPWVGPSLARQIRSILHEGTCEQLEQMRCRNSSAHGSRTVSSKCRPMVGCHCCMRRTCQLLSKGRLIRQCFCRKGGLRASCTTADLPLLNTLCAGMTSR